MRFDILQELGLPTRWKVRANHDKRQAADVAVVPSPVTNSAVHKPVAQSGDVAVSSLKWEDLRRVTLACENCGLCKSRSNVVFGVGDVEADILFVGEGPGRDEDRLGEPFVGASGQLLDKMLAAIGLNRDNGVYIANIVKCRPPENRNPSQEEVAACMPYLKRQIELIKPRLIVALGRVASIHLLQSDKTISELRQRPTSKMIPPHPRIGQRAYEPPSSLPAMGQQPHPPLAAYHD